MVVVASNLGTSKGPILDESAFPLVIVSFGREAMTDAQIEDFIAQLTAILRRRQKHLVIMDALWVEEGLDARQRKRFTDFVQNGEMRDLSRYKMADVLLLKSPILRGMLTAVFWLAPPVSPTKPFADIDEALPFIKQRFKDEGVPFTQAMEARLQRIRRR